MRCNRWIFVFPLFVIVLGIAAQANAERVADFEDVALPDSTSAGDFYNGADGAGGFTSHDIGFNNSNSGGFWSGWAASNSTDTTEIDFTNQYSAFPGNGAEGSDNFGVAFNFAQGASVVTFPQATEVIGTYITNGTYPALTMLNGDSHGFAKKFGGLSGDDPDWFKLKIIGKDAAGLSTGIPVDFYLADYQFADNSQDYVISDWTWVDLTDLGTEVRSLEFELTSSDVGAFGMNTPSYFLVDNLATTIPEPTTLIILLVGVAGMMASRSRIAS